MIEVQVPTVLRKHTAGERVVQMEGATVAALIDALEDRFPGFRNELLSDSGEVRRFVNIYVNDEDIRYLNQLGTRLESGDRVAILPALAGGGRFAPASLPGGGRFAPASLP